MATIALDRLLDRAEEAKVCMDRSQCREIVHRMHLRHFQDGAKLHFGGSTASPVLMLILLGEACVTSLSEVLLPGESKLYATVQAGAFLGLAEMFARDAAPTQAIAQDGLTVAVMSAQALSELNQQRPDVGLIWQSLLLAELARVAQLQSQRAAAMARVARSMIDHIDDGEPETEA